MLSKLKIGVSSCLLGAEVRFNGGHCKHRFVTDHLSEFADYVPYCPEMAIGMGVPRESVRLERDRDTQEISMRAPKSGEDFTEAMEKYCADWARWSDDLDLDGYVFKKNSPSCGVFRVKIYENGQPAERRGTGMFAKTVMETFPDLPVEEEGRLSDPLLRENFVERVFAYRRVKDLFCGDWTRKDIVEFHSREKLLLMAHSPDGYRKLGRLVGEIKSYSRLEFRYRYTTEFMSAMNNKPSKGRHANALEHMSGYLKSKLSADGSKELKKSIEDFRKGRVPLVVPMTLIGHMIRRCDEPYLEQQSYLAPHPEELALRSHLV